MKTSRFSALQLTVAALSLSFFSAAASAQNTAPALTAYYGVKDALVATNASKAKAQAASLTLALSKVEAAKLSAADQKALAMAKTHAAAIGNSADVDDQRAQFEMLSTSMISLAKATKPGKSYVQFCPMAANGKGAFWLSDNKDVRNPYYGDKMLKCGSVKEEI